MAKKKKDEATKDQDAGESARAGDGAPEGAEDSAATGGKKRKLVLILGIASIGLAASGVGGFFILKTFGGSKTELAAKDVSGAPSQNEDSNAAEGTEKKQDAPTKPDAPVAGGDKEEGSDKKQSAGDAKNPASAQDEGGRSPDQFGDTIDVPKMELNLGNPLENRFLRFGLSMEYHGGDDQRKELERRMPQIRDLVISIISRKTRIELLSADGKESFRKQLKNTLNELLTSPVTNVYFTEFLVE